MKRKNPDFRSFLQFLLIISVPHIVFAQSSTIDVNVCVFDQDTSAPLDSAMVEASIEGESAILGVTSADGCTTLSLPSRVSIEDADVPRSFSVGKPFPNPVYDVTHIPLRAQYGDHVSVALFDILGRQVRVQPIVSIVPGEQMIQVDLTDLPAGMYLYSVQGGHISHSGTVMKTNQQINSSAQLDIPSATRQSERVLINDLIAVQFTIEREGYHGASIAQDIVHGEVLNVFLNAKAEDPTNNPPALVPIEDMSMVEGDTISVQIQASDGDGDPVVLSVNVVPEAGGEVANDFYTFTDNGDSNGTLQFTPQAGVAGLYTINVEVSDGEDAANVSFLLTVNPLEVPENTPPSLSPIEDLSIVEGATSSVLVFASDSDGDPVTLSASVEPDSGGQVSNGFYTLTDNGDGSGSLLFAPQVGEAGLYTVDVAATDGMDTSGVAFTVTVTEQTDDPGSPVPLNDLGSGTYLGFQGGLYPNGLNTAPTTHHQKGLELANTIQPLDNAGNPSPDGKIVLMSIGMSNTTQEFCSQPARPPCDPWTFMGQAAADAEVDTVSLVIVNGALGGQPALEWDSPDDYNYDRVKSERLEFDGLSENQVQVVWVKQANPKPKVSLPDAESDAYALRNSLADIARALRIRYPNLKQIFFSSRIYAGYANGVSKLNPEPYAYESGFSVKWVIEAQIDQIDGAAIQPDLGDLDYESVVPWMAWGPYMWADGMTPRSDGLIWEPDDFAEDFTHPGQPGEEKVGAMLLSFFKESPYTACWFTQNGVCE